MRKLVAAARTHGEGDPLFVLMSAAAGVSFAASAVALAGFALLVL